MLVDEFGVGCWMDAAVQPADWGDALVASARRLGATAMCLCWRDRGAGPIAFAAGPAAPADFIDACNDMALRRGGDPAGERCLGDAVFSWERRSHAADESFAALFALSPAPLDRDAFATTAALARGAVAARGRMDAIRRASALKAAALDQLPSGVAIVDDALRVEEMNEAFKAILARADGLGLLQGRLSCRGRQDQAALARAVAAALGGDGKGELVRIARAGGAQPYVARAISPRGEGAAPRHCLLMTVDPDGAAPTAASIWRAMFDLTDCELIIAEGMVSGRRISDIAQQRGVSVETVRTQTKRMFERLNVSSQAEAAVRLARAAFMREVRPAC